jgi:uncharacterized protein YdbL (DUF1318 family)
MTTDRLPWRALFATTLVLTIAGCVPVTINIVFPQEKIDTAAASIESLVRAPRNAPAAPAQGAPAGPAKPEPARPSSDKQGGVSVEPGWAAWLTPVAEAQVPELKTRTPEVMAVIESRRARYPAIAKALAAGCLGENNQGLLEPRPGPGCGGDAAALAQAENRDRLTLYQTLVEQNKMPPGDIARVQRAFAKVNRDQAPAGAWVQDDAGQWARK